METLEQDLLNTLVEKGLSWDDLEAVTLKIGDDRAKVFPPDKAKEILGRTNDAVYGYALDGKDVKYYAYTRDYVIIEVSTDMGNFPEAIPRNPTDEIDPESHSQ